MNIVVAPDSFKGSLPATQVAETMKKAIMATDPQYIVTTFPMADGGEGTVDSFLSALAGERIEVQCLGPLGKSITTEYGLLADRTAIIECANIAGLTQVPEAKKNPDDTTTYGIGEVIIDALDKECEAMIIGLGGSATNDGGLGMLLALGMKAYDAKGQQVDIYGKNVRDVHSVDFSALDPRLQQIHLKIASDVDNPLCGVNGASAIYGPQKGMTVEQVKQHDKALKGYSQVIERALEKESVHQQEGAGAAGGLGFALTVIGGEMVSGAELIAKKLSIETAIKKADAVITGEGQSDRQTLYGKAPGYIATLGKKYNVPVILISGGIKDPDQLSRLFSGSFSIVPGPYSLVECMEQSEQFLYEQTKQIMTCIRPFWRKSQSSSHG